MMRIDSKKKSIRLCVIFLFCCWLYITNNAHKESETVDKTTTTTPDTEVCLQPPHDSWQRHYSVWLAHTLEHECECVCVLFADRNLIYFNGGILGCEAVRCEAPAELSSAGAYNNAVSWGPALMAWGALTAIVPSRSTPPCTYKTPSPYPPPCISLIFQYDSVSLRSHAGILVWGAHGL